MSGETRARGASLSSFEEATLNAFESVPGDPSKEGLAAAEVARLWVSKGGVVGTPQFHVEIKWPTQE